MAGELLGLSVTFRRKMLCSCVRLWKDRKERLRNLRSENGNTVDKELENSGHLQVLPDLCSD